MNQVLHHIKQSGLGLYAWLVPDLPSILALQALTLTQNHPDIKWDNSTELHCTVVYHEHPVPEHLTLPNVIKPFPVQMRGLDLFGDHVVLRIESERVRKLFDYFKRQGTKHSFDEYNPHITLGKRLNDVDLTEYINDVNLMLKGTLTLKPELNISLLD